MNVSMNGTAKWLVGVLAALLTFLGGYVTGDKTTKAAVENHRRRGHAVTQEKISQIEADVKEIKAMLRRIEERIR